MIADSSEAAREAAARVRVSYDQQPHDVVLRPDHPDLYAPEKVNPSFPTDTSEGDVEMALRDAAFTVEETYSTPMQHNNPMEPHATIAVHDGSSLTLFDSTQGVHPVRQTIAPLFGLEPEQVRVISPFVGGGFGSKGTPHAHIVLAGLAALAHLGRPVKLALTRQQMFALVGYRTPTIQRVRLGADETGRLQAISHQAYELTSKLKEFAEQTAVVTRMMYASPNRLTATGWRRSMFQCRPGCAPPANAQACSPPRSRSTSSPNAADLIRSSCGSATSPPSIPNRATHFPAPAGGCLREGANGSAGRRAILARSAPRRRLAYRIRRRQRDLSRQPNSGIGGRICFTGDDTYVLRSGRPTSGRAHGPRSLKSPPTR